ncbi:MAG: HAD family hydrolase [Acidimicrobiia bacterium]
MGDTPDVMRLASWREGVTRRAILEFIDASTVLPAEKRVAVFDNDGTLWCEKPAYIQLLFMLDQLRRAVRQDPALAERIEYKALLEDDKPAQADLGLPAIAMALVELGAGIGPDEFDRRVKDFVAGASHPRGGLPLRQMRYQPMLELIQDLKAHDFSVFIVTGGGTEFVRAISNDFYGVDPERVVGSLIKYEVQRDVDNRPVLIRTKELFGDIDEGAPKVSNMQLGLGRRPIFAAGNSPGDTEMLEYAMGSGEPSMALLVNHDDADREFAYEAEAASFESQGSFAKAGRDRGWTVVSMKDDWDRVFSAPA